MLICSVLLSNLCERGQVYVAQSIYGVRQFVCESECENLIMVRDEFNVYMCSQSNNGYTLLSLCKADTALPT